MSLTTPVLNNLSNIPGHKNVIAPHIRATGDIAVLVSDQKHKLVSMETLTTYTIYKPNSRLWFGFYTRLESSHCYFGICSDLWNPCVLLELKCSSAGSDAPGFVQDLFLHHWSQFYFFYSIKHFNKH